MGFVRSSHNEKKTKLSVSLGLAFLCGATGHFYQDLPGALHVNSFFGSTESPDGQYGTITQTWGGTHHILLSLSSDSFGDNIETVRVTQKMEYIHYSWTVKV